MALAQVVSKETPEHRLRIQIFDMNEKFSRCLTLKNVSFTDAYAKILVALKEFEE